jgi:hypothetical protein
MTTEVYYEPLCMEQPSRTVNPAHPETQLERTEPAPEYKHADTQVPQLTGGYDRYVAVTQDGTIVGRCIASGYEEASRLLALYKDLPPFEVALDSDLE